MSLIQRIVTRRMEDIINQGYRLVITGSQSGAVTNTVIQPGVAKRTIVVTGMVISSNAGTDTPVTLAFQSGAQTPVPIFYGAVKSGSPITYAFTVGDERYSNIGDSLVITTAAGTVYYTVFCRIIGEAVPIGYIEYPGASGHAAPQIPVDGTWYSGTVTGNWYTGFSGFSAGVWWTGFSGFSGLGRGGFPN